MRSARFVALCFGGLALTLGCASGPPKTVAKGPAFPSTCLAGLCLMPDHVMSRRVMPTERRCVITAWDGPSGVPPTAKVSVADEAPTSTGVFFTVEVPNLRAATPYAISSDPMSRSTAQVLAVQVTPAGKFSQHVIEEGTVTLIDGQDDITVVVKANAPGAPETLTLVLTKFNNQCGPVAQ